MSCAKGKHWYDWSARLKVAHKSAILQQWWLFGKFKTLYAKEAYGQDDQVV